MKSACLLALRNFLTRSDDWRSSPQICPRRRRRRACTSCRNRLPSSPLLQRSGSHCAGTPEGLQSRPAEAHSRRSPPGRCRRATEGNTNKLKSSLFSNLAGVDAAVHVARAEHAVVQRVAVDVGSFAFLLGDEDNASVQQLVGAVPL